MLGGWLDGRGGSNDGGAVVATASDGSASTGGRTPMFNWASPALPPVFSAAATAVAAASASPSQAAGGSGGAVMGAAAVPLPAPTLRATSPSPAHNEADDDNSDGGLSSADSASPSLPPAAASASADAGTEPSVRCAVEAAEAASRSTLLVPAALQLLCAAAAAARAGVAAAEQEELRRLRAAERFAPVRAARYHAILAAREEQSRAKVAAAEEAARAALVRSGAAALRAAVADAALDEADSRAAVEAAEAVARRRLAADAAAAADAVRAAADAAAALASHEGEARAGVEAEEAAARAAAAAAAAELRAAAEAAAAAAAQDGERAAALVEAAEGRARGGVEASQEEARADVFSLATLLRAAHESEVAAAANKAGLALQRAAKALGRTEAAARAEAAEEEGRRRGEVEAAAYEAHADALVAARRRVAARAQAEKALNAGEGRGRAAAERAEEEQFAALRAARQGVVDAWARRREARAEARAALEEEETAGRVAVSVGEERGARAAARVAMEEGARRLVETEEFEKVDGLLWEGLLVAKEAVHRNLLVDEEASASQSGVQALARLPQEEAPCRVRTEEEEAIFRGSLVYRLNLALTSAGPDAAAAAAPDAATKPRGAHRHHPRSSSLSPARLERRDTPPSAAASSHGCSPEAVSLSSPSTSARTSPLDPVALTAPASPFLLQVLIAGGADGGVGAAAGGVLGCGDGGGGGAAAGARFEAGDYAEVGGDLETVARACRQAEAGWCEEMGRYLGQTGLVAQEASADGSVLLCFADHRQHWFASEVLGAASADGVRSAPARVPGSAAAEASRSLLRAYLNTVLPGGDHAGWQNIVYFVLIPLFMLVSGIYMAWYRYNSTI